MSDKVIDMSEVAGSLPSVMAWRLTRASHHFWWYHLFNGHQYALNSINNYVVALGLSGVDMFMLWRSWQMLAWPGGFCREACGIRHGVSVFYRNILLNIVSISIVSLKGRILPSLIAFNKFLAVSHH